MTASQAVKVPEFDMPTHNRTLRTFTPCPFGSPVVPGRRGCSVGHPKRSGPDQLDGERRTRRPNSGRCPDGDGPTQPPTRPTASRTGRRRPGDPRDLLTSRLRDGNGRHGPEVHLVRTVANPRPTAPNEHRVWEPNVDNISWPDDAVLPICSHYDARAANSRSFKDQQSTPYTGFDLRKSSSANEVTEVELRGFEPLTL
jgi:hypothetical protein